MASKTNIINKKVDSKILSKVTQLRELQRGDIIKAGLQASNRNLLGLKPLEDSQLEFLRETQQKKLPP